MSKNIIVVGGGIIGLSTAYYLQKEGHQVTVIDKSDFRTGASYVNAGYITPSHIISLASPGIITQGLKWMFDSSSPFYVKPRLDIDFLKWSWAFKKSANAKKVATSIPVIKEINLLSRDLYEEIKASNDFNFQYERKGLMMYYQTDKVGEHEWNLGKMALKEGLHVTHLTTMDAIKKYEPNAKLNVKGAVYFDCDAHMTPGNFMQEMIAYLKYKEVQILANETVIDIAVSNQKITEVITNRGSYKGDEVVMAAGSWSPLLTKKLGIKIPIQAGKGYAIDVERETDITIPSILCEAKVAVTPMKGFTRFAGTMEIDKINHCVNPKRVDAIANAAKKFYSGLEINQAEKDAAASGLRPCSPDGLPYIGKSSKCKNLTIAAGHAMMGWSLGPVTGKLVTEIISNKKPSLDLKPFSPDRKF